MSESENQKMWGGRFTEDADPEFADFNRSFGFDRRLFDSDVRASLAHCGALGRAGILTGSECSQLTGALRSLLDESAEPGFFDSSGAEDVHSFIESRLVERIGDVGRKLHTGRSRNDQVATAFRLWLREEMSVIDGAASDLQRSLLELAGRHPKSVIPGYTHLQKAQPVMFAHWCLAYFEMLRRDRERLAEAAKRVNVLPLGSGALAGSGFPVDRAAEAEELGFSGVTRNSLDAVSDRDFAIEAVGAMAVMMMHLSRLAEDVIVYSTSEFGLLQLGDAVSTGSSLMPQKKNPDAMELVRGKAARVFGHHAALLAMMKGLPLAYNKDMQEDKEAVFDSADTSRRALRVAAIVLRNTRLDEERANEAAVTGFLNATELADYLVRKGVPFRRAHESVGGIVSECLRLGCELGALPLEEMKSFSPEIEEDVFAALALRSAVGSKSAVGGTAPARVAEALEEAWAYLDGP